MTQGANTTESYSYDLVGNRLSSLGVSPYSYNNSNQLASTPAATYTYDNNGNTLTKLDASGATTYAWDFENRLVSVVLPGSGGTVSFKYDPFGRRIQKSSASGTTNYAYDGADIAEEVDSTGSAVARYAMGPGIDQPLAMLRGGATSYYQVDGLGSITSLTDGSGTIAASYTYDSFGKLVTSTGTLVNSFRYTGRDFDAETGLYYYRARYYDSSAGRFLSEDPVRFSSGVDFYSYVTNDPTNLIDPLGLQGWSFLDGFEWGAWKTGTRPPKPRHLSDCVKTILRPYFPGLNPDSIELEQGLPFITIFAPIKVGAITWNRTIYYEPGMFSADALGIAAIGHEIAHVQQQNRGLLRFSGGYVASYVGNLSKGKGLGGAYAAIQAEKQATALETRILGDLLRSYGGKDPCERYCQ